MFLANNNINTLASKTFQYNPKIEQLYLQCNNTKFISEDLLKPLANLRYLFLNGNRIGTIDPILYSNLRNLEILGIIKIG